MIKSKHPIISADTIAKVVRLLETGSLSSFRGAPENRGGYYVQALEEAFCEYFGVKYAISMNSATSCLHAALLACGPAKKSVIVTPYSMTVSATTPLMVGAKPKFVDIEEDYFCMNPQLARREVGWATKAIIPVNLCGQSADISPLLGLGIPVIEDAAQSIGAKYKGRYAGTLSDCGIFSFNQSKQISSGEGGMLVTNNDWFARVARAIRNHAEVSDPDLRMVGWNYRMCEVEALLVLEQFKKLDENIERRTQLCEYMLNKLSDIDGLTPPKIRPNSTHTWYTFAVKYDSEVIGMHRDEFQDRLMQEGVYFGKGYVKPIYLLPIFDKPEGLCPVTERMWREELMVTDIFRYPMTIKDCEKIVETIKKVIRNG
jgi:dTDP-4-amino-4,6-dideoxygalactose transaminase